ncbi:hypothetical protein DER46DRAFT_619298 [Fusarium sp. MPI-SDFR-AT-0072]|nr:hypothetical protein DER46DRAFT_619298 [Fusarium sp. MPI-SDFR-AT-0072]
MVFFIRSPVIRPIVLLFLIPLAPVRLGDRWYTDRPQSSTMCVNAGADKYLHVYSCHLTHPIMDVGLDHTPLKATFD